MSSRGEGNKTKMEHIYKILEFVILDNLTSLKREEISRLTQ